MLQAIPDILGHLRSLTDPLKGTDYAQKASSIGGGGVKVHAPPPVPVELFDAADYLVTVLWWFGFALDSRELDGPVQVHVGADAASLVAEADAMVAWLIPQLPDLSERPVIVELADAVIGRPASADEWTVRTILERWSLTEDPWWAAQPCPVCKLRAIKVTPPKTPGDETNYRCASCTWVAPDDVDGFWASSFSRREGKAA